MFKHFVFITLFTFYCVAVLAKKYSITLTTEDFDSNTQNDFKQAKNAENNNDISIDLNADNITPDTIDYFNNARNIVFSDLPGSPMFINSKNLEDASHVMQSFLTQVVGLSDNPDKDFQAIMRNKKFSQINKLLHEIMEDSDLDEFDDYETDDEYFSDDENQLFDVDEDDEDYDEFSLAGREELLNNNKFIRDGTKCIKSNATTTFSMSQSTFTSLNDRHENTTVFNRSNSVTLSSQVPSISYVTTRLPSSPFIPPNISNNSTEQNNITKNDRMINSGMRLSINSSLFLLMVAYHYLF